MDHPPIAVDVHESEPYSWTMAHRAAHGRLVDHVVGYSGYVERSVLPLRRREVANDSVVVIISFGEPIDVQLSTELVADRYTSFVAGLHDGSVFTEHGGRQAGVEIRLSPLGAFRLLGVPSSELAHRVVEIDALGSRPLVELADRLASAPDWPARFDLLDAELLRRAAEGPEADPAVRWAWRQLVSAHGNISVSVLAEEIGWSRRHFVARFRHHVGLAPKPAGRVLRFNRAVQLLTADGAASVSDVAAACGYADHSHLVRDFHDLAAARRRRWSAPNFPTGAASPADGHAGSGGHVRTSHRGPGSPTVDLMTSARAPSIYPVLRYAEPASAIQFLVDAFGFAEHEVHRGPDGEIAHAELSFDNGMVMLGRSGGSEAVFDTGEQSIYVVADDVDALHARAVAAGAKIVYPLTDQDYGSRDFSAKDPGGNVWSFGTYRPTLT